MIRFLSRFTFLFPLFYYIGLVWLIIESWTNHWMILVTIFHCYFAPILLVRFFNAFWKFAEGRVELNPKVIDGMMWVVSYRAQMVYELFPFPEKFIRVIPEVYSLWLNCWGSRVGRNIIWAPNINIFDRCSLNIGNNVIVGSGATMSCHTVDKYKDKIYLFYAPITIGDNVFVGANTVIGPGVNIPAGQKIKFATVVYQDRIVDFDEMDVTVKKLKSKFLSE